jgi:hypothetical protein
MEEVTKLLKTIGRIDFKTNYAYSWIWPSFVEQIRLWQGIETKEKK